VAPGDGLVVGFSGGPDSTALLLALAAIAPGAGWRLLAAHVDHGMDAGSAARATAARGLAASIGVPCEVLPAGDGPTTSVRDGREAAARRLRYHLLDDLRRHRGARWLLTAHHAGDQAETVLLRLLLGSGLAGLAGIPARRDVVLRPLLAHRREALAAVVAEAGLQAVDDPTNRDLTVPRNRLRHALLAGDDPAAARRGGGSRPAGAGELAARATALAAAAAGARRAVARRVAAVAPVLGGPGGPRIPLAALLALPVELRPWALAALHAAAGLPYPPRRAAVAELSRQLAMAGPTPNVACDCSDGWRWVAGDGSLALVPATTASGRRRAASASFAYTLDVPGGVEIREAGTTFRLTRQPVAPWMRRGSATRAALDLPLSTGDPVTVRNRRPGDRLRPFGCSHERRLKDVLIDRKVPMLERDRLPLLCVEGQVAWVPGVTVHDGFRLRPGCREAWVAELLPRRGEEER
jgi:tRNA(Ile)-lysidine synthetase-like protein